MIPILLSLLAVSPSCETSCGLRAAVPAAACAALQAHEDKTLAAFERRHVWTAPRACAALKGWVLERAENANAHGLFADVDYPSGVWGMTHTDRNTIDLGSFDWPNSALPHELAHVIDFVLRKDSTHNLWTERGICAAINDVSNHLRCRFANPALSAWVP